MANNTRRKGFSLLSFLLGILLGIIILAGTIVGVVYYALTTDVDSAMKLIQMENKDENGNSVYINTDVESGGAKNLLDLLSKAVYMAGNTENLSVGEIENLLPAITDFVDQIHGTLNEYIAVPREELVAVKFSQFGDFVQEKVMEIQPAPLLESLGMNGLVDNSLVSLMLLGKEAGYAYNGKDKYPVYYDEYIYGEGGYRRANDGAALPAELESRLSETDGEYRLYFYDVGMAKYVTDSDYTYYQSGTRYSLYSEETCSLTGYYYRTNADKRVIVTPITISDFADGEFSMLDEVYITDVLGEGNDLIESVLGNISIGQFMDGTVEFDSIINDIQLSALVGVKADDGITSKLIWSIDGVKEERGADYTHTGVYSKNGNEYPCYIDTDGENIKSAYYYDGSEKVEIKSLTVGELKDGFDFNEIIDGLAIPDFMDIKAEDAIMAYIGYGVYGLKPAETAGYYGGKYDLSETEAVDVTVITGDNGIITDCYYTDGGERVTLHGTGVNDLSGLLNGATSKLTIGDLIGETEDKLLSKLSKYTIDNVSDAFDEITIGDVMDIDESDKLLSQLKDTPITDIPDKINTLKIGEIMDISDDNTVLKSLADSTIKSLPEDINNININEIFADEIYKVKTGTDDEGKPVYSDEKPARKKAVAAVTDGTAEILFDKSYVYYVKSGDGFKLLNIEGNALGKITDEQFAVYDGELYTYGAATGVWKVLLYNEVEGKDYKTEAVYTVNNLTEMMQNVAENISNSTLRELYEAGILDFKNPENLNNKIYTITWEEKIVNGETVRVPNVSTEETIIGDMGLMDLINHIVQSLSQTPSNG